MALAAWRWRMLASSLHAQSYRGAIRGVVQDATNAFIPGAAVTAKNLGTGETRSAQTVEDGGYVIPELVAGEYEITAEAKGLVTVRQKAVVIVGQDTTLNIVLGKISSTSQTIIVNPTETVPLIETSQTELATDVQNRLVRSCR